MLLMEYILPHNYSVDILLNNTRRHMRSKVDTFCLWMYRLDQRGSSAWDIRTKMYFKVDLTL